MALINGKVRQLYLQTWQTSFEQDNVFFETALQSFRAA
jgi:hypothetical protein